MGDLVHALPAITEAKSHVPTLEVDWVVDSAFQEIALWHPAVKKTFTTQHRKWRKELLKLSTWRAIFTLILQIRSEHYDLIIDGQGNFKSALIALFARGLKVGFDRHSAAESIAALSYHRHLKSSKKLHAIVRLKSLFAFGLRYSYEEKSLHSGIDQKRFVPPSFSLPDRYLLFIHNATWKTKLWPESSWKELIARATSYGYTVLLPWGSNEEKSRAERLILGSQNAIVLPKLSLNELGFLIRAAKGCVAVDTGLSHIAAALGTPTVTLYGATDPNRIGARGNHQLHLTSSLNCAPCLKKRCALLSSEESEPPCLAKITPERAFKRLIELVQDAH